MSRSLIFRWPEKRPSLLLPGLLIAAAAAHALAFYVFQVAYPNIVSIAPPPKQVLFVAPTTAENQAFLRRADASNPIAAKTFQGAAPPGLEEVAYTPSYVLAQGELKAAEHAEEAVAFPPAHDSFSLMAPDAARPGGSRGSVASAVAFSEELRDRAPEAPRPVALTARSSTSLQQTRFLIGVGAGGELRFSFLQESCGNSGIDKEAREQLERERFKPVDPAMPVAWGFATFTWGADAFSGTAPGTTEFSTGGRP